MAIGPTPPGEPRRTLPSRAGKVLAAIGAATVLLVAIAVVLALRVGGDDARQLLVTGEVRELQPAVFQSAPLRTTQGGIDRIHVLGIQSETISRMPDRRRARPTRVELLHVDLWAIDPATATVAWRRRLRSWEGAERLGRDLRGINLLGVDGRTLWLELEGPLGVSLVDGGVVADGARIDARNPDITGRRVDDPGYVAFGRNGLQLTLEDGSQWRIDASDLGAAPRDTPVREPDRIVAPASYVRGATSAFQVRAIDIGDRWLGLLTTQEADTYRHPPVVPGRAPDEEPGVMQEFLEANHVPPPLSHPLPEPYRLWSARVEQVSAAPRDWPADMPGNWGTRPRFGDYALLPDAPGFLRAGLLRQGRESPRALWYRGPDSVLVLHADKLGKAGRLQLSRISGPAGKPVWRATLPMDELQSVMPGDHHLAMLGRAPPPSGADRKALQQGPHLVLSSIDIDTGAVRTLDLTAASLRQPGESR